MITSIFSKSKPINFIITFFIIGLACAISFFKIENNQISFNSAIGFSIIFICSYFCLLILNFISGKNNLTQTVYFEIVLYALFVLLFPQTTERLNLILANIFLLFSLRRIISLRSQKEIMKKLFDAAFWITIAALCYSWAALFLVLLIVAVILYTDGKIRNWLIPLVAILAVISIAYTVGFVLGYNIFKIGSKGFQISLDFSKYNTTQFLIGLTVLISFGVWSSLFYIKNINRKKKALRPSFYVIFWTVIISFFVLVIAPKKTGGELLFTFAPLSIVIANYVEIIYEKWFKEVFFTVLILVPILLLFL